MTQNQSDSICPLTFAMDLISKKWRLKLIWAISQNEPIRYNELKRNVDGITNMMLTQTLKSLESHQIIFRQQYQEIPPRVEYSLTPYGHQLLPALKSFAQWGETMMTLLDDHTCEVK